MIKMYQHSTANFSRMFLTLAISSMLIASIHSSAIIRPELRNITERRASSLQTVLTSSSPPPALHLNYSPIDEELRLNLSRVLAVQFVLGKVLRALGPAFEEELPTAPTNAAMAMVPFDSTIRVETSTCPSKYTRCSSSTFYPSCQIPKYTEPYIWQNRFTMFFNISHELTHIERRHMMNATLRLYKNLSLPLSIPIILRVRVHAYTFPLSRKREQSKVVGSKRVSSDYVGWVSFNVNRVFRRIKNGHRNFGLKISVKNGNNDLWDMDHFIRMDCQASNESLTPLPFEVQLANPAQKYPALNIRYGIVWPTRSNNTSNISTYDPYPRGSPVRNNIDHNNMNRLDEIMNPRHYGRMQAEQAPAGNDEHDRLYNNYTEVFEYYTPINHHQANNPSNLYAHDDNSTDLSSIIANTKYDDMIYNSEYSVQNGALPTYRSSTHYNLTLSQRDNERNRQHERNRRRQISHARRVLSRQAGPYQSTQSSLYPASMGINPVASLLIPGNRSSSDRGTQPLSSEIDRGLDIEAGHRSPGRSDGAFMVARISSNLNQRQSRLLHRHQDQFSKFL